MDEITYVDRTFLVGRFPVRIELKGEEKLGESRATWHASTEIPYRDGEDAGKHFTLGCGKTAYGAVLSLGSAVSNKADVILDLSPLTEDYKITPLYRELCQFARQLSSLAWGTCAGWEGGLEAHAGHPTFEEVTSEVAA
jgi:hypothetical protein